MALTATARVRSYHANPEIIWQELIDLIDELQSGVTNDSTVTEVESGDGAIGIVAGLAVVTKGSAAALTLAAPTAGDDDGKRLRIVSTTAFAHVITTPASKVNGTLHVITLGGAVGDSVTLEAYNGKWYQSAHINAVIS